MDKVDEDKKAEGVEPKEGDQQKKQPEPIMIPKGRLDEKIAEVKRLEGLVQTAEDAKREQEADTLAEQGKYKELYETQLAAAQTAETALADAKVDALKKSAAQDAGHPQLWNRLTGDTEEAITADMKALVSAIPQAKAPNLDGGTGSGKRSTDKGKKIKMSDKQKEYLAGILGVSPQYLPDEVDF